MNRSLQSSLAIGLVVGLGVPTWFFLIAGDPLPMPAPPRDLGPVPVETRSVQARDLPLELRAYGNLEPSARVAIACELGGRIDWVNPHWRSGGLVRAGELLFALDETALVLDVDAGRAVLLEVEAGVDMARVEIERARRSVSKAREQSAVAVREHVRMTQLAGEGATSESLVDRALKLRLDAELAEDAARTALQSATAAEEAAQARVASALAAVARAEDRLQRSRVSAPFTGRLTMRPPPVGRLIAPGESLGELLDVAHLLLVVQVPEAELVRLRPGLPVSIALPGPPETDDWLEVSGIVGSLPARTNPLTRHGAVEIEVDNPYADAADPAEVGNGAVASPFVPAGVFGCATIDLGVAADALWIDRRYFVWRDGKPIAFVLVEDGEGQLAERRELVFAREYGEGFLLREGLVPGDVLILSPLDRLEDGTECRAQDEGPER